MDMPRLGLEDMPKAGLIRSDQFLMFAILFMAFIMMSTWVMMRPHGSPGSRLRVGGRGPGRESGSRMTTGLRWMFGTGVRGSGRSRG